MDFKSKSVMSGFLYVYMQTEMMEVCVSVCVGWGGGGAGGRWSPRFMAVEAQGSQNMLIITPCKKFHNIDWLTN